MNSFNFKPILIVALLLAFMAGFIAPERADAQGITGTLKYKVLKDQKLVVYSAPSFDAEKLGQIPAGTYTASEASMVAGGWYSFVNKGATWYIHDDPSVVTITFTPGSTGNGNGNGNGGGTTTNMSVRVTLGAFKGIPGGFLILMLIMVLGAVGGMGVLSLTEAIKGRRGGLLIWAVATIAVTIILLGGLAYFNNTQGEKCLENIVCIASSPGGYALSGLALIITPLFIVLMFMNGRAVPKAGASTEGKKLKLPAHEFYEEYEKWTEEGLIPLGRPQECVGEDAGQIECNFVEKEEAYHHEGAPIGLVVTLMTYGMLGFGLVGLSYFGPFHFRELTQPVFSTGTIGWGSVPFFLMAFLPVVFYGHEAMVENQKRSFILVWWALTWIGQWFSPWPPILTFALMHMFANSMDDKGKNFWGGHSDLINLTLAIGLGATVLGFPFFFSIMGGFWLDHSTWLPSVTSIGANFVRSIVK